MFSRAQHGTEPRELIEWRTPIFRNKVELGALRILKNIRQWSRMVVSVMNTCALTRDSHTLDALGEVGGYLHMCIKGKGDPLKVFFFVKPMLFRMQSARTKTKAEPSKLCF